MNITFKRLALFIALLDLSCCNHTIDAMKLVFQRNTLWNSENPLPHCVRISPCGKFFVTCEENGRVMVWDFESGDLRKVVAEDLANINSVKIFQHSRSNDTYFIVFFQKVASVEELDDLYNVDVSGLTVCEYNFKLNRISNIYSYAVPNETTFIEDFTVKDDRFLHVCLSELMSRPDGTVSCLTKIVIDIYGQKPREDFVIGSFDESARFAFCDDGSEIVDFSQPAKLSLLINGSQVVDIPDVCQNLMFEDVLPSGRFLLGTTNLCSSKLYNPSDGVFTDIHSNDMNFVAAHKVKNLIASTCSLSGDFGERVNYFCLHDCDGRLVLNLQLTQGADVFDVLIDSENLLYMIISVGSEIYTLQISLFDFAALIKKFPRIQAGIVKPILSKQLLYEQSGWLGFNKDGRLVLNLFNVPSADVQVLDVRKNLSSVFESVD